MKKREFKGKYLLVIGILLVGVLAIIFSSKNDNSIENNTAIVGSESDLVTTDEETEKVLNSEEIEEVEEVEEVEERIETIEIAAVGDFLMHIDIVAAQRDYENGGYNFDSNLEHIKEYLSRADLTIANLETTFAGEESGYSGYPCFNTPDELGDAMKNAGIDIVSNMSNHSLDKGEYGFFRTRQVLKEKGFDVVGTRDNSEDKRYIIKEVKGIKVGITAYGYTTEGYEGGRGLNGIPISDEVMPLMNTFNPYDVDADLLKMKEEIKNMREEGVDAIVFYMHWGEEYQLEPNESQLKIAQFLADEGVDIIFGDHPHTIQPIDIISSTNGDHNTVVVYSLGNLISSQRTESIGNPYTEDGLMVFVNVTKNFKSGEVTVDIPRYVPTWVKLNVYNGQYYYQVVPAENSDAEYLDYYQSERTVESFNRTTGIVESYNDTVDVLD